MNTPTRKILSVSQLTENIKLILESKFSMVWICGEVSNIRIPPSGHAYFTLKDNTAQISGVMFRGQLNQLKFNISNGMMLVGLGRISVYSPHGNYQVILEYAEPQGVGALQIAFEQLKLKLEAEGLFSKQNKLALPYLPKRIGIATSPSGAVIRDILKVLSRRYDNMIIDIYPVRVQGHESAREIVNALSFANRLKRNDVLIIARGGGAIEDLAPFNSEEVARAIFASKIPIVSAVGHETDYSISDFVADMRAPTPSAAAEMIVPVKSELKEKILLLKQRNERSAQNQCLKQRQKYLQVVHQIVHPEKKIQDKKIHLDHLTSRLEYNLRVLVKDKMDLFKKSTDGLTKSSPNDYIRAYKSKIEVAKLMLIQKIHNNINKVSDRYKTAEAVLNAVNPSAILKRGYSIARTLPDLNVVMDSEDVTFGQLLEIQFAKGKIDVSVIRQKVNSDEK